MRGPRVNFHTSRLIQRRLHERRKRWGLGASYNTRDDMRVAVAGERPMKTVTEKENNSIGTGIKLFTETPADLEHNELSK